MPDPELDAKLRTFLEDAEQSRRDGFTLRSISGKIQQHEIDDERRFHHLERRFDHMYSAHEVLTRRVDAIEQETNKIEHEIEDTGKHQIESLHRALREHDEEKKWWKRHAVKLVSSLIVAILLAAGGTIFGMLLHK